MRSGAIADVPVVDAVRTVSARQRWVLGGAVTILFLGGLVLAAMQQAGRPSR